MSKKNPLADLFEVDESSPAEQQSAAPQSVIPDLFDAIVVSADDTIEASIDLSLDVDSLELESKPLESTINPITGETVDLKDVAAVIAAVIDAKQKMELLREFDTNLRRAAGELAAGTTKTRRLSAKVDGELRTIEVHMPDDEWPAKELGAMVAWCTHPDRKAELGKFAEQYIRAKPEVKYSPIKAEVKKLLSLTYPDGSMLQVAKDRLLKINKGTRNKLPTLKLEGETRSDWEQDRFGD